MLMKNTLTLNIMPSQGTPHSIDVDVEKVGCSRNAGRDIEATDVYLDEIRAKGYQVHPAAGICFRSRYLITNEETIEVQGPQTSGEVEFVAVAHQEEIYISVGSDHNDRTLEELWTSTLGKVFDTAKSKQMVPGVVARDAWPYDEVKDHWDEIVLKSHVTVAGQKIPYQEFRLANLLDLEYYLSHCPWLKEDGSVLLGGSSDLVPELPENVYQGQASLDGVIFPPDFHVEMIDPVLDRSIAHSYSIVSLEESGSLSL